MKVQNTNNRVTDQADPVPATMTNSAAIELYAATRILFRAFHYLQPRMHGGALAPPALMNGEALAGCILHSCMSRLVREMKQTRESHALMPDWLTKPSDVEIVSQPAR
jgi:hypothetical protein